MRVMVIFLWAPLLLTSCKPGPKSGRNSTPDQPVISVQSGTPALNAIDPCSLILIPHQGTNRTDQEISRLQEEVKKSIDPGSRIEKLGWSYVRKARESFDTGFYK